MRKVFESDVIRNVSYHMNFGHNREDGSLPENAAALAAVAARDLALGRALPAVVDAIGYFLQTRTPEDLRSYYPDGVFASSIDDASKLPLPKAVEDVLVGKVRPLTHIAFSRKVPLPAKYQRLAYALADDMAAGMERRDRVSAADHRLSVGGRGEAFRLPGDGALRREDYVLRAQELVGVFMKSAADPEVVLASLHHDPIVDSLCKVGRWALLSRLFPDDESIRSAVSGSGEDVRLLCEYDFLDDGIVDRMRMQMDSLLLRARDMRLGVREVEQMGLEHPEHKIDDGELAFVTAARIIPYGSYEERFAMPYSFTEDTWVGKDFVPAGTVVRNDGGVLSFDAVSTQTGGMERYDSRNDRLEVFDALCREKEHRLGITVDGVDVDSIDAMDINDMVDCLETTRELMEMKELTRSMIVNECILAAPVKDVMLFTKCLGEVRRRAESEAVSATRGQHIR